MSSVDDELKEFFVEAFEMLEESETSFLKVGKGPDFKTTYSAVFRTFHSLKGAAGMFELLELQKHMHQLENTLTECQPRNAFTQSEISFFLKGIDAAKKIIGGEKVTFDYTISKESPTEPVPAQLTPSPSLGPKKEDLPKAAERRVESPKNPQAVGEIVVIDDEVEILNILEHFFLAADFNVRKFSDPKTAVASIKERAPDIVFTDMMMPGLSGLDVLNLSKEAHPDLPVVFVSAHLDKALLIDCIQKGAYSVIEKPFKDSLLISTALTAIREVELKKLIQRSLNLLLYQFADLDDFLKKQGKKDVSESIRNELKTLIETQKEYRKTKRPR